MVSDKVIGGVMVGVGVIGITIELITLIISPLANEDVASQLPGSTYWAMAIPLFLGVVGVLGIVTWIGVTMITTPLPESMEFEDFEDEKLESTSEKKEKAEPAKKETKTKAAAKKEPAAKKETPKEELKEEPKAASGRSLEEVDGVTATVAKNLKDAGYESIDSLKGLTVDDLVAVKGIGKKTAERIIADI